MKKKSTLERIIKVQESEYDIWEYRYTDGKVYSRHSGKGFGCFFTEWEEEYGSTKKDFQSLPYTDYYIK